MLLILLMYLPHREQTPLHYKDHVIKLFREIIVFYFEDRTKCINIVCEKSKIFLKLQQVVYIITAV
jgi:hypothetical protein